MPRHPSRTDSTSAVAAMPFGMGRSGARLVALVLVVLSLWLLANFIGQVIASARMDRQIVDIRHELSQMVASDYSRAQIDVKLRSMSSDVVLELIERTDAIAAGIREYAATLEGDARIHGRCDRQQSR